MSVSVSKPSHDHSDLPQQQQQKQQPPACCSLRFVLLAILVIQNSLTAVNGRYTRSVVSSGKDGGGGGGELYDIGHFVLMGELGKLVLSLFLEAITTTTTKTTSGGLLESLRIHIRQQHPLETVKIAVPALLYFASNSLRYVAASYLNVPVFQVAVQSRLVTTACLSVVILKRRYSIKQWLCLVATTVGVATVVLAEAASTSQNKDFALYDQADQNLWLGLSAIGTACLLGSTSGVYFEKVIKQKRKSTDYRRLDEEEQADGRGVVVARKTTTTTTATTPSLWICNIQLAFFSVLIATIQSLHDGDFSSSRPFFHGFTVWVWLQVCLFAGGGIVVAAVTKHADNVLKGLATCISMVVSSCLSRVIFRHSAPPLSLHFLMGATWIVAGVYFFFQSIAIQKKKSTSSILLTQQNE